MHRIGLAVAVNAADPLVQDGRVPGHFQIDDRIGELQIQADTAGVGGKEDLAVRIIPETLDEPATLGGGNAAVETHEADTQPLGPFDGHAAELHPLAKDDHLADLAQTQIVDQLLELVQLR